MVFVKKSKFLSCVSQKRCSVNILDRKERFLDHKSEIEILDHKSEIILEGFLSKLKFSFCVLANQARKNSSLAFWIKKGCFLD